MVEEERGVECGSVQRVFLKVSRGEKISLSDIDLQLGNRRKEMFVLPLAMELILEQSLRDR